MQYSHEPATNREPIDQVLAHVHRLQRSRSLRDSTRHFWVEGIRQFVNAVDARLHIDTVLISPILLKSSLAEKLTRQLAKLGVRRIKLSPEQFRTIHTADRASGIGAIVRQHWSSLDRLDPLSAGLGWLVIESIRSPGNLGSILRTAEATGVGGVIFCSAACDPFDPAVVRAAMGGIFHLRLVSCSLDDFRRWSRRNNVQTIGLSPRAPLLWTQLPSERSVAVMLGEERAGLSPAAAAMCDSIVRLPMVGRADSLNVSVAAGVMMYELLRRKDGQRG
jgi:TrmH family RNA methyltransferase